VDAMTEEPLNFERAPEEEIAGEQEPLFRDLHTSVTRKMWQTHGMMHSVKDAAHAALEAVSRLTQRMSAVSADGVPEGDYRERLDRVERALERERYAAPPRYDNGGADEGQWKTVALIALGLLQTITIAYIGYIHSTVMQTHDDVVTIKCKLDPQCRVVVTSDRH
jgi:hypothetical protein